MRNAKHDDIPYNIKNGVYEISFRIKRPTVNIADKIRGKSRNSAPSIWYFKIVLATTLKQATNGRRQQTEKTLADATAATTTTIAARA